MYKVFLLSMLLALVTGCGHNVVTNSRGTGVEIAWDGSSYIPTIRLGQWDVTSVVVKENVTVDTSTNTTTAAGTQVASTQTGTTTNTSKPSGQAQAEARGGIKLTMKTGQQSNGYVKDILTSPNLSQQSVLIAEKIYGVKTKESDKKK